MNDSRRRRVLQVGGAALVSGLAGFSGVFGSGDDSGDDDNDIQDTDGDGVIDSEDYAPRNPNVQRKEQVEGKDSTSIKESPDTPTRESTEEPTEESIKTPADTSSGTPSEPTYTAEFEDGTIAPFTKLNDGNWEVVSTPKFEGDYALGIDEEGTPHDDPDLQWFLSTPLEPEKVDFHFYEYASQQNGALYLLDERDNIITGGGTNSPQWTIRRDLAHRGKNWYSGDGFRRWVKMSFRFDYDNSTVTVVGHDFQSGTTRETAATMINPNPVNSIVIASNNYRADPDNIAPGANFANPKHMFFDNIRVYSAHHKPC